MNPSQWRAVNSSVAKLQLLEIPATNTRLLWAIGVLRVRAWAARSAEIAAREAWLDEVDAVGRHFAIIDGEELVAAARVSAHETLAAAPDPEDFAELAPIPTPIASLNRLVVAQSYRGLGLGIRLVEARLAAAEQMGCRSAVTSIWPDDRIIRRMERLGFVSAGLTKIYRSVTYGPEARFMVMTRRLLAEGLPGEPLSW